MSKAGFDDDQLVDISSVRLDDVVSAPAAPGSGQEQIYHRDLKLRKKSSAGVEKTVGPQDANEVPTAVTVADNALVGSNIQAILNKYFGPTNSEKPTYLANGELDYLEFFSTPSQVVANRIAKITFTYDGSLNPTGEVLVLYSTDGTTVLKTVTLTHSFSGTDYTSTTQVTS